MGTCYKCGTETDQACLWCRQAACEMHLEEVDGAKICKKCYKDSPDYQVKKMQKVEKKMKIKNKRSLVRRK